MARALIAPVWEDFQPGRARAAGPDCEGPDPGPGRYGPDGRDDRGSGPPPRPADARRTSPWDCYEDDPRDAAATLDALRPPATAARALLDLADQVPDAPADVRDDLLTRALARAREVGEPSRRVALLARVADRRFEAGEPEKARTLIDEAREAFKDLVSSGASLDVRVDLADALARVDLPAALALLEPARRGKTRGRCSPAAANTPPVPRWPSSIGCYRGRARMTRMRRFSRPSPAGPRRTTRPAPSGSSPG